MSEGFALRKNVTMSIVAFVVNILLVLIGYRLVIQNGGLSALGLWATLMSWIFIIRLADVGMATATVRYVAKCDHQTEGQRIRTYVDTGIMLNTVLFVVLALVGFNIFSAHLEIIIPSSPEDRAIARSILPLMFAGFVISNLSGLVIGALKGIHRAYLGAWIMIAGTVVQLVSVIALVPSLGLAGLAIGRLYKTSLLKVTLAGGCLAVLSTTMMVDTSLDITSLLVACVALGHVFGGLYIKWRNEKLLGI